ncbi:MAG: hypothetical protein PHX83_15025 [Acidobacteriia bacterium]|nr:hypothetical protein [Terriglobia bacterium]
MKFLSKNKSRISQDHPQRSSRRRLLKALALAPSVALLPRAAELWAQESKPKAMPGPPPRSGPGQLNPSPEALSLAEIVQQRYGKYLTAEQLEEVKLGLERGLRGRQALRHYKFENGDEPCTTFSAE